MILPLLGLIGALAAPLAPAPPTPYAVELAQRAAALRLDRDPTWWALVHYRQGTFGPYSEADGPGFFFAPDGADDPRAELEATLAAFFRPGVAPPKGPEGIAPPAQRHPQCNFPARFAWLAERLDFDPARLPRQPCPSYDRWRAAIGATGVTLVFADAFLNSPASMYGHTFLRLDKGSPLLSYAVNFSAAAQNTGGLIYAIMGLTGGFDGYYATTPYYVKVQEYSNVESRDLWEYRLALSPPELDRLLAHAWELGTTTFDYYFFDENCSYQLLTLLDAARPGLDLAGDFPFAVIPTDTLRSVIERPGLVAERRWRPAHRSTLLAHRDALSPADRDRAEAVADGDLSAVDGLPPPRQARVLETGHLLMRWRAGYRRAESSLDRAHEQAVLRARAALGLRLPPVTVRPRLAPPEAGHPTARLSVGGGVSERGAHTRLGLRFALHDLLDDETGYHPGQVLEKLDLRLRWDGSAGGRAPYLEQVDFVEILSVTPAERWLVKPAWRAQVGLEEAADLGCAGWSCTTLGGRGGVGLALGAGPLAPVYVLAQARGRAFGPLADYGLLGLGGLAGARLTLGDWRVLAEGEAFYDVLGHETGLKWEARLGQSVALTQAFAIRFNTLLGNGERYEVGFAGMVYY